MKKAMKWWGALVSSGLLLLSSTFVFAQQKPAPGAPERDVVITRQEGLQGPEGVPGLPSSDTFIYVASEMNFDGKVVKGAPYSAQAVSENIQTLSDGNRIVNKTTASVYRDSEGRTRREHTLAAIGPFATMGDAPVTISINDPVAGVNYALDPRTKIAHKMAPMQFKFKMIQPPAAGDTVPATVGGPVVEGPGTAGVVVGLSQQRTELHIERTPPAGGEAERVEGPPQVFTRQLPGPDQGPGGIMHWEFGSKKNAKNESLGKQTIEGVEAEGTRTTITIPAGEIGNERAIEIVSERWYSPELQVVVMTHHIDPRFGENSYRLTNISRRE